MKSVKEKLRGMGDRFRCSKCLTQEFQKKGEGRQYQKEQCWRMSQNWSKTWILRLNEPNRINKNYHLITSHWNDRSLKIKKENRWEAVGARVVAWNHDSSMKSSRHNEKSPNTADPWTTRVWSVQVNFQNFLGSKNYSTTGSMVGWICRHGTSDREGSCIWTADYQLHKRFQLCGGLVRLTPTLFKDQMQLGTTTTISKMIDKINQGFEAEGKRWQSNQMYI